MLAAREWRHPISGDPVRFSIAKIERWYRRAVKERHDPVGVLRRKVRTDSGQQTSMTDAVRQALFAQYAAHQSWSTQLHHDNLDDRFHETGIQKSPGSLELEGYWWIPRLRMAERGVTSWEHGGKPLRWR